MKLHVKLSDTFDLSKIDVNKTEVSFVATEDERAKVRETLMIPEVSRLEGTLTIRPWHKTGFMIGGDLSASVAQECVVTLERVEEEVETRFERSFLPPEEAAQVEPDEDVEVDFALESEDPPDILDGHTLNLLKIVSEHLALGLEPYPRKEGAQISDTYARGEEEDAKENPFDVLKQLKE